MKNKHSQPTQCPTSLKIPANYFSETKRICDAALAKAQARVRFSKYTDDNTPTKTQGTSTPTKSVPSAFCYIASKRICDPAGKRAAILRRLEAVEERKLQTAKQNKIPLRH